MRKIYLFSTFLFARNRKLFRLSFFGVLLLIFVGTSAQTTTYYTGNFVDLLHYKVVENSGGTGSRTASGTGIKFTSPSSDNYYILTQRMNDASRSYIDVSDLFPTNDTSGTISFKITDQPAPGKLVVRLGLYSVNDDCSIISMPITYSGDDAEYSTVYSAANQASGTTYVVDFSSNEMRTQFNAALLIATATRGPYAERPEGFVLKFGWASYTGAQSSITIDNIVYKAPSNLGVTPVTCFNTTTILPVTLKSFEAKSLAGSVRLSWATAIEQGNSNFVIERSTDAKNFTGIGNVAANGASIGTKQYLFDDNNPLTGTSWYRLRMNDKDGSFKYSDVKSVFYNTSRNQTILIQSGQSAQSLDLYGWNLQQPATLSLIDASGRTVNTSKVTLDSRTINLSKNGSSGVYLLRLQQDGKQATVKVVL